MQHATSTEKTDGPPAENPHERVVQHVTRNWRHYHQHNLSGIMSILREIRRLRGGSVEIARVEEKYRHHYDRAAAAITIENLAHDDIEDLDSAHGELMNMYEERGFRLGLAVAAAMRDTDDLIEAIPGEADGGDEGAPETLDGGRAEPAASPRQGAAPKGRDAIRRGPLTLAQAQAHCPCDFLSLNREHADVVEVHDAVLAFESRGFEGVDWLDDLLEMSVDRVLDGADLNPSRDLEQFVSQHNWTNPLLVERYATRKAALYRAWNQRALSQTALQGIGALVGQGLHTD